MVQATPLEKRICRQKRAARLPPGFLGRVVKLSQRLQHLEEAFLHSHAGLYALNDLHIFFMYQCTLVPKDYAPIVVALRSE